MSTPPPTTDAPAREASMGQKGLSFFNRVMGSRDQDYTSDAPGAEGTAPPSRGPDGRQSSMYGSVWEEEDEEVLPESCVGRFWYLMVYPGEGRRDLFRSIVNSKIWRNWFIFATILNLFGSQFRDLFLPKEADFPLDIIFTVLFGYFCIDILMRIEVEPEYAPSISCSDDNDDEKLNPYGGPPGIYGPNGREGQEDDGLKFSCNPGSFVFWCETLATLAVLWDLTYLNTTSFSEKTYDIYLDNYGVPIDGLEDVNRPTPVEFELELLVTIARTARVARFIRSGSAVDLISKVNWVYLFSFFSLTKWCQWFNRTCGTGRGGSDKNLLRENDWGSLSIGLLAFLQENRKTPEEKAKEAKYRRSLKGRAERLLRFLGVLPDDKELWRRNVAATKIQRAWKGVLRQRLVVEEDSMSHSDRSMGKSMGHLAYAKSVSDLNYSASMFGKSAEPAPPGHGGGHVDEEAHAGDARDAPPGKDSQLGNSMRELTGRRVALGIMAQLIITVLFTYTEYDATRPAAMIVLHNQTGNTLFANRSLEAAINSSIPNLYEYTLADGSSRSYTLDDINPDDLRDREKLKITVYPTGSNVTIGMFSFKTERQEEALSSLLSSIFQLLVWFFGVTAFAGPVMMLVVIPIERMIKMLGMMMKDPLGYQSTSRYRKFVSDGKNLTANTPWTNEVMEGMETSFLMSTITRIGSLMKVGFGSAGAEIIKQNLGRGTNELVLNSQGTTVACIFLFCDIRQFTDATECLQEEVFVFTNRIAAVVHSIVHSHGGSANKNIGDAFLLSWKLEKAAGQITAKSNQADKAMLAVVKICMALYHDKYYIQTMSERARKALLEKLSSRKGTVVQMGCGLHAGLTVQGAIGSKHKIDPTYVSESVERVEFLESSTKKYGVKMLMSDSFHRLLHPNNRRRCRKVDQVLISDDEEDDEDEGHHQPKGEIIELWTFDMHIEALWKKSDEATKKGWPPKLVIPTGLTMYHPNVWSSDEIKAIRQRYTTGLSGHMFFQIFNQGFQAYYSKDWDKARDCFEEILGRFEDGPSRNLLKEIEKHNGKPPRNFREYGIA